MKTVFRSIEDEFLFFDDDELGRRLQMPSVQVQECLQLLGLERSREGFEKKFGRLPENLGEDDVAEIWKSVLDKGGHLPGFLFAQEDSARLFARVMVGEGLKALARQGVAPDKLPASFTREFCSQFGLDQVVEWAKGSLFALVDLAMPGRFRPWQFGETEAWLAQGHLEDRTREALDWLMTTRLGCSRGDLPQLLTLEVIRECGLEPLVQKYGNSVYKLVQAVYPDVFQPWQFADEEALIWFRDDRHETARAATRWLVETRLSLPGEEIPRRISLQDFHHYGLAKLLDLFSQNLYQIFENAYPGRFKAWEFAEMIDLWRAPNALEMAREATYWLVREKLQWEEAQAPFQLTRRHFLANGLGFMLGTLFNHSPFMAIENAYEAVKTDETFQKSLFSFSQEMRDTSAKWTALGEKIAVSHFGKARFKVTLPNLKVAPIVPETDRMYYNAANQIEYVPQIVIAKLSAYDDFSDFSNWVPYCDRLLYWVLSDDRAAGYIGPSHPKVKLVFAETLMSGLRTKGLLDVVEKVVSLKSAFERLLDRKAPGGRPPA